MTLFWHDHFATSIQKVKQPVLMIEQNELFREHAFGNFRELTQEVVKDPAMMIYLDTQRSSKAMPNENFAREVMELFTLGEGNYTEEDVKEAARAFTGYRLNRLNGDGYPRDFPMGWRGENDLRKNRQVQGGGCGGTDFREGGVCALHGREALGVFCVRIAARGCGGGSGGDVPEGRISN